MRWVRRASGSGRCRRRGAGLTAVLGTLLPLLLGPLPLLAQQRPVSAPTDTFADPAARALIARARAARDRDIQWLGVRQAIPIIGADTRHEGGAVRAYVVTGNGESCEKAAGDTARNQVTARVTVGQAG